MTLIASLHASATAFDSIGLDHSAETCRALARDCAAMADTFGDDAAHALYRHWTTQMAERATDKLFQHHMRNVA